VTAPVEVFWCPACQVDHPLGECPLEGVCLYCKTRPATLHFGDALSFTHGGVENCCAICAAEMQLQHARERAAAIPELEAKVAELRRAENNQSQSASRSRSLRGFVNEESSG
jgi:hypothetical protein